MTTVQINRVGTDQTVLELMQTGSSETAVTLRHNLLDAKLSYMFSVSSLSVPLNNAPIHPISQAVELFRVERRNVGRSALAPDQVEALTAGEVAVYSLVPGNKFFDVSAFVRSLANWARGFNIEQSLIGLEDLRLYGGPHDAATADDAEVGPLNILDAMTADQLDPNNADYEGPYNFLNVQLSPDGSLQITGTDNFWNNFVLRFTSYGAYLLGFADQVEEGYVSYTEGPDGIVPGWHDDDPGQTILPANLFEEVLVDAAHPVYQSADQRVKISVESHLPMISNLAIIDEIESVDRTIAEKYFENKLETAVFFDNAGEYQNTVMRNKLYSGQVSFIKKSDPHNEWYKLLSAYELRFFRFHLFIWYRIFQTATNTWKLTKRRLEVPENQYWLMSLRFVSES